MNTFIGNIEARADDKGRIFIPANYRRVLAEVQSTSRLVIRRDTDNACLIFYPEDVWNKKVNDLKSVLNEWDPNDNMILMQFMSEADYLDMDSQGRVLLSRKNLQQIDVDQDVVFVGLMDRFALWNPANFEQKKLPQTDLAAAIRAKFIHPEN